jgi:hypothetical protein
MPPSPQADPSEPLIIRLNPAAAALVIGVHLVFGLMHTLFAWWVARTPDPEQDMAVTSSSSK